MKTNKKHIFIALIILFFIFLLIIAFQISFEFYGFKMCQLFGGSIYTVDSPFANSRECHIFNNNYNEADSWDTNYPQYHQEN